SRGSRDAIRSCGRTGRWVYGVVPWREPYELRGSSTVLREARGEPPRAYSPRDSQSRQSGRGTGVDARGAGAAGTDTEREEDEPLECTAGAIRFSGVHIRTALQRTDWQGVHRIQPIEEEREQDEAERGRLPDARQQPPLGGSARPAASETERLER